MLRLIVNAGPGAPVAVAVSTLSRIGWAETNVGDAGLADVSDVVVLDWAEVLDTSEAVVESVEVGDVELDVEVEALDESELLDVAEDDEPAEAEESVFVAIVAVAAADSVEELGAEDRLPVATALSVGIEADELAVESEALEVMLLWDAMLAVMVCIVVGAADKGSAAAAPPFMLENAVAAQKQEHMHWPAEFLVPVPWRTCLDEPMDAGTVIISIEYMLSL